MPCFLVRCGTDGTRKRCDFAVARTEQMAVANVKARYPDCRVVSIGVRECATVDYLGYTETVFRLHDGRTVRLRSMEPASLGSELLLYPPVPMAEPPASA